MHIPNPTVSPQHCGKARGMFKSNSSVCLVSELGERHDIPARDLGGWGGAAVGGSGSFACLLSVVSFHHV